MIRNIVYHVKANNFGQIEAWIVENNIKYWSMSETLKNAMLGAYLNYYHKFCGQKLESYDKYIENSLYYKIK